MNFKTGIIVALCLIVAFGSLAYALTVHKEVLFGITIVDELEEIAIYEDAAHTIPAEFIDLGEANRGGQYVFSVYAVNESETRTTLVRAEIFGDIAWAEAELVVAPTSVTLAPGESIKFDIGLIVPISAELGYKEFGVRFYSDPDASPPSGVPLQIEGHEDALFNYWAAPSGVEDIPQAPSAEVRDREWMIRFMVKTIIEIL